MNRFAVATAAALWFVSLGMAQDVAQEPEPVGPIVAVVPIEGMIDDGVAVFVKRVVDESADARAIVLLVDTPGGRVDRAIDIAQYLSDTDVPTIAFVQTGMGATSAGALISFACDDIIMMPESTIGAAQPIMMSAEGPMPTDEKSVSFLREKMRALAETNGHNPDIAEAMVDSDVELCGLPEGSRVRVYKCNDLTREEPEDESAAALRGVMDQLLDAVDREAPGAGDPLREAVDSVLPKAEQPGAPAGAVDASGQVKLLEKGKLLTLSAQKAYEWQLIETKADSLNEVLNYYGHGGYAISRYEMSWDEEVYRWLRSPMISGILLLIGIGGLYLELQTPGVGLPGAIGLAALAIFFGAGLVLGISDWVDILLLVIGVALLLVELLLLPGFGVAGISGLACILAGIYLSLVNFTIPQYEWDYDRLKDAFVSLTIALSCFVVLVAATWRFLPESRLARRLVLASEVGGDAGFYVQEPAEAQGRIGQTGTAVTMLRPAGTGRFEGKNLSVVTRGEFLDKGEALVITQVDGNRYVVERVKKESA